MTEIYESNNYHLIKAGYCNPTMHRHLAAHIIVSIDGQMKINAAGKDYMCHGIMIPSGIEHNGDMLGKSALVFLYENTTDVAQQITEVQVISEEQVKCIAQCFEQFCGGERTTQRYKEFERAVYEILDIKVIHSSISDERILAACDYIKKRITDEITCKEVADAVFLSEGRFSHLFKEQMGITFAGYLIIQRIFAAYASLEQGSSITEAALSAGFASSAHLAAVNKKLFGLSASDIIQDVTFYHMNR